MRELGIDISGHRSKSAGEFADQNFDYVLTVAVAALALDFLLTVTSPKNRRAFSRCSFVLPPDKAVFQGNSLPAVSPDGRRLAFVATLTAKISFGSAT
jgi:hypothetical protein